MNKIILCFTLIVSYSGISQYTYVPDDNFELALLNLGFDFVLDDYVETAAIDTITDLQINNKNISDLTGIEDFILLRSLFCYDNNLTHLNLSSNSNLFEVTCSNNNLNSLDLRNGNNANLWYFMSFNNPELSCIDVNNIAWCEYNFAVDTWTIFSNDCNPTNLQNINSPIKKLIKIVDTQGKRVTAKPNTPLFYIYNDGTVEKKMIIE